MEWTNEQKQAIEKHGSNLLVSAGAGSGKTTILIARIINKIINEKINVDDLLVVTFTDAAQSEMKDRLINSLYEEAEKKPHDVNLRKQIGLVSSAHISTIHSFCLDVIRNNFYETNLSANFRVADTNEIEIIKQEVMEDVFENKYEEGNESFIRLLNLYTTYKDDQPLKDLIFNLHNFLSGIPNPRKWIETEVNEYNTTETDFFNTKWGKVIKENVQKLVYDEIKKLEKAKTLLENNVNLIDNFNVIVEDLANLQSLDFSSYDNILNKVSNKEWAKWPSKNRKLDETDKELKDEAKSIRDSVSKEFKNNIQKIFYMSSSEIMQDINKMYPVLKDIMELEALFESEFQKRKLEKNIIDYSDIEHITYKLLVGENGEKTHIAEKYSFNEIMIDEYQDSSLIQEEILKSVSNGHNIFMVGDVKQSIYRFRQAKPELFLQKYETYKLVKNSEEEGVKGKNIQSKNNQIENMDDETGLELKTSSQEKDENNLSQDSKILLYKNFRSRKNILDFVNYIFESIMSKELGEINYNEDEYLNCGATFKDTEKNIDPELYVITKGEDGKEDVIKKQTNRTVIRPEENEAKELGNKSVEKRIKELGNKSKEIKTTERRELKITNETVTKIGTIENQQSENAYTSDVQEETEEQEEVDKSTLQARFIASKIKELVNDGYKYRDITILLKSPSVDSPSYEKELIRNGIPVFADIGENYLQAIEIDTILSLLKIIDNPLQDIPLVTVMRSMIGGFTDNDLIAIRLCKRKGAFYYALEKCAQIEDFENEGNLLNENQKTNISKNDEKELSLSNNSIKNDSSENKEKSEDTKTSINQEKNALQMKCKRFLEMIAKYREFSLKIPIDELIWKIITETGYYYYVSLMPNGKLRQANLRKLFEKAKDYEKMSLKGIFNFITFIEKVESNKSNDVSGAKIISENADVVRIMSIHKSKGLEFNVVFVSSIEKGFNFQDMKPKIVYDQELGIGVNFVSEGMDYKIPTKDAINLKAKKEKISEEMRVLYVALTRAKERLILVGYQNDVDKKLHDFENELTISKSEGKINTNILEKNANYLSWIELVYKFNRDTNLQFNIVNKSELKEPEEEEQEEEKYRVYNDDLSVFSQEKYNEIDKALNYEYPYGDNDLPSKTSVTALKTSKISMKNNDIIVNGIDNKTNEVEISKFIEEPLKQTEIPSTERGTLVHLVLQKLKGDDIEGTINSLRITDTQKEYLKKNTRIFESFINSSLFKELENAKEVHKEETFYMNVKSESNDDILLQGIIDLYFIDKNDRLILVDYKTDRNVDKEILIDRYKNQLLLYKNALEKSLDKKVSKTLIYSTFLNTEVEIDV